jgi:hypothetical protein
MGKKNELFNDWDTFMDPLSAGECHNVKLLSGPQYKNSTKFINNHIADITSSMPIKKGPFFVGINGSFRLLGFPARYTTSETTDGKQMNAIMHGTLKFLYGLNVGVRKNIGNKAALFVICGVNTGANKKGSTAIQVLYNPFINPTIFIGGKYGAYGGIYWEMMQGKNRTFLGLPNSTTYTTKMNESQIQIKIGFYLSAKKE